MNAKAKFLNPPPVNRVRYAKNFIKTAVCELRFPTILELENRPPREFQGKIRKSFPIYEPRTVENPGNLPVEHHYLFKSADQRWTVVVKCFALSLETNKYSDFEEFRQKLNSISRDAKDMIDSDFLTRVGLRYINEIPVGDDHPSEWINPALLGPLAGNVFGDPQAYKTVISGTTEIGGYTIRHGMSQSGDDMPARKYSLDFDYFQDNVELANVDQLVNKFNEMNFAIFSWCLGRKATELLGEGRPK